MLIIID